MSALNIKKGSSSHSAYELRDPNGDLIESHTLAVVVDNESGVLARVIGLFSGRGYNIDSLTVAEVDHEGHLSRITVVTRGTPPVIAQIKAQLDRLVPVHEVHDLTAEGPSVQRELALFKVAGKGEAPAGFILAVTLWLWVTLLFANFAEAVAEGRGKAAGRGADAGAIIVARGQDGAGAR